MKKFILYKPIIIAYTVHIAFNQSFIEQYNHICVVSKLDMFD
jgi:hypothetical protein